MKSILLLFVLFSATVLHAQVLTVTDFSAPNLVPAAAPTITPGAVLTINGAGFQPGDVVLIGNKPSSMLSLQPTQIKVNVPAVVGSTTLTVCDAYNACSPGIPIVVDALFSAAGHAPDVDNGIVVSGVNQYSDASLQAMLDSARTRLAAMQFFDQGSVSARLGALQGSSYTVSSLGISASGPSIPGVTTTANTGNVATTQQSGLNLVSNSGNTVTTQSSTPQVVVTSPSTTNTISGSNQVVATGPSVQTVTTQAAATPTAPTPPTSSSFSLPSGFQAGASDILNEQLQLTSQIEGYQLLLEGSLTDRFMQFAFNGQTVKVPRTRITLGVPVDIRNAGKYPNAVAEVTLTVTPSGGAVSQEPPVVTAQLPTEKTYNVASIVDKNVGLSGAMTTAIASVGVSWLWGHKTFYVVKDQDTLAFQVPFEPKTPTSRSFGWQFRPTLGQVHLTEGPRQVFVQLGLPFDSRILQPGAQIGVVSVTTVWKAYDRKKGVVSEKAIENSTSTYTVPFEILHYDLTPTFGDTNLADNGDGTVALQLAGSFLSGTTLRSGSHIYGAGNPAVQFSPSSMLVTMPATDALADGLQIVDQSGGHSPVVKNVSLIFTGPKCFTAKAPVVHQISSTTTRVDLSVAVSADPACKAAFNTTSLVAVIGNKVFGLGDAPFIDRKADSVSLILPTDYLRTNRAITLKRPLWGPNFEDTALVDVSASLTTVTQTAVVEQSPAATRIALLGTGLSGLTPVSPGSVKVEQSDSFYAILNAPTQDLQDIKQIVLKDASGSLLLVSVPAPGDGPSIDKMAAIRKGGATLRFTGSGLDKVVSVSWNGSPLTITSHDKKSITISATALLAHAGTQTLSFQFTKGAPAPYTITVVDRIQGQVNNTSP